MKKKNHVWVVEISFDKGKKWEATCGCALTRKQGNEESLKWQKLNPPNKFRLKKYVEG